MTTRITYPGCSIEGHAQEPLSRLCIDEKCENKSVLCCMCEYSSHNNHKTIAVKHLLKQLGQDQEEEALKPLEFAKKLQLMRYQFFSSMKRCKSDILDFIDGLETKGNMYFNRCEQSLLELLSLSNTRNVIEQSEISYRAYFKKILELYSSEDKNGFSLKSKYEHFFEDCKSKEKKINDNLDLIVKQFQKNIEKIQQVLQDPFAISSKVQSYNWSETLKGGKIKIEGMVAEQTGMQSSGQRFAMMDQTLSQTAKSRWGIKVKKFVGWVGVGICLKNSIKNANYHFNYTNIGHGSYLISTNGYSWSHSVKQFNSAFKTFQFTVNDIVYIEYDPKQSKLRFRKNQGNDKFELDVTPPPSGDSYHPCINLCSTGDSVELIVPGFPLS